jgi:hypothetical protein
MEPGVARMQAAWLSPEMGIVVDTRISLKVVRRGTPTVSSDRKAAVLGALWRRAQDTIGV